MKRHSTDVVSLVFGAVFILIAGWWMLGWYGVGIHLNVPNLGLIAAGALILLGLAGIVGSLRRDKPPARIEEPVQVPVGAPAAADDDEPTLTDPVPERDKTDE